MHASLQFIHIQIHMDNSPMLDSWTAIFLLPLRFGQAHVAKPMFKDVAARHIAFHTVTTFRYVEGGPDREAQEGVQNTSKYQFLYLVVVTV